ncbi:tetratricopeptide repeat protein [Sphingomonas montana]|uniref:tetratricopeptide repeat protein n=1 Tax=Sphingomonas montana TaxID=1843236 RepID=UPI00096D691F|nr:tetratricopeptide repeat protein [Sphingomonas montana]
MTAAEREAIEVFRRDVVEPSMDALVIVDFWADWCGPCKALTPLLEKIAADYAARGVKLVKVNVDENKAVAAQFRIQSLPTVYAIFQGQLVADMTPARTEGQLTQMLDQILKQLPLKTDAAAAEADLLPLIAMAEEVLDSGDAERALSIYRQLGEMAPDNLVVVAGEARALLLGGAVEEAAALLDSVPAEKANDPALMQARAALALAQAAAPVDDLAPLEARIAADPDDHDARYELAGALMTSDRDRAADVLLESIARDRDWNEGAARARLLTLFAAVGLMDPWVGAQRRRLSAVLFT